jgi:hypothetical protein
MATDKTITSVLPTPDHKMAYGTGQALIHYHSFLQEQLRQATAAQARVDAMNTSDTKENITPSPTAKSSMS